MASERETCIEFMADENFMIVYTCENKYIRRIEQLKEEYPRKVKIMKRDENSIMIKCPKSWFKFPKPKAKRNLSDEQRKEMSERMKNIRNNS